MDATKIPKPSCLKPPTKIIKAVPSSRLLPIISEGKSSGSSATTDIITNPVVPLRGLRRRSKSTTDLRGLQSKPIIPHVKSFKTAEKSAPVSRVAQKRPALQKNGDENKPKVPKVKIPDWDYKSRFHELQKKHTVLQEDYKLIKAKISNIPQMEEELEALRKINETNKDALQSLQNREESLTHQNACLIKENRTLQTQLAHKEEKYQNLKSLFQKAQEEHKENLIKLRNTEEAFKECESKITVLEMKCADLENLTHHLKQIIEDHENLRRVLHNNIQDLKGNIRVFCRVRPPVTYEEKDKLLCAIFFPSETGLEIRKSRESVRVGGNPTDLKQEFSFDRVFDPEANQEEVFEELSQLVQSALDGYHVCVFAYGQTGSGKTFTMQGTPSDRGMIPRTIDLIFEKIKKLKVSDWSYTITASFLEIYNENIRDLLVPHSTHNYEVRYNEGRGVTVTNLKIVSITSAEELKDLMDEAHKNRAVAATDFNEHSSRSHAVTKIHLKGFNSNSKAQFSGSINLVDLAGSESAKTTAAERLTETKNINKSLSTLGNVMLALHNKDAHIPYRNSKLTFLLQSCLGGNSKTLMFVNISPFDECFGESINSLRFASKVKDVKIAAKRNRTYALMPPPQAKAESKN